MYGAMSPEWKARWRHAQRVYEETAMRLFLGAWVFASLAFVVANPEYRLVTLLGCTAAGFTLCGGWQMIKAMRASERVKYDNLHASDEPPAWTEEHNA